MWVPEKPPQKSLCVGPDDFTPVDPDTQNIRLNGSLKTLKVTNR